MAIQLRVMRFGSTAQSDRFYQAHCSMADKLECAFVIPAGSKAICMHLLRGGVRL